MEGLKISIITPNYNYGNYLGKLIESVLSQDYENFEHIVIDDGSTDNSLAIIEEYSRIDSRIKLLKQKNYGQTIAINNGLRVANGDIVCWINSDDFYEKNVFSRIVNYFESNPETEVVFGDWNIVDKEGRLVRVQRNLPLNYSVGCFLGFGFCVQSNTVFWKRQVTARIGFLKENLRYNMDGEYFSRMAEIYYFEKINVVIANFRIHDKAKTIDKTKSAERFLEYELEWRENYKKTWQSKMFSYEIGKYFKYYYKLKRILLRLIYGHYKNYLLQIMNNRS